MRNKIGYKKSVFTATQRAELRQDIIQSVKSSPELRMEVRRVFQQANRRIQNIEAKGLLSPAVTALNKGDIKGYSKFSVRDQSWDAIKTEYARAVSFLRQPTSTAQGTRAYNNHLKAAYGLTDEEFNLMADKLNGKLTSLRGSDFVEKYLMRYKDFTGDLEQSARDVSAQIESDAVSLQNAIDRNIESEANKVTTEVENEIQSILDDFNKFGL
jgi:hypothetical protein